MIFHYKIQCELIKPDHFIYKVRDVHQNPVDWRCVCMVSGMRLMYIWNTFICNSLFLSWVMSNHLRAWNEISSYFIIIIFLFLFQILKWISHNQRPFWLFFIWINFNLNWKKICNFNHTTKKFQVIVCEMLFTHNCVQSVPTLMKKNYVHCFW